MPWSSVSQCHLRLPDTTLLFNVAELHWMIPSGAVYYGRTSVCKFDISLQWSQVQRTHIDINSENYIYRAFKKRSITCHLIYSSVIIVSTFRFRHNNLWDMQFQSLKSQAICAKNHWIKDIWRKKNFYSKGSWISSKINLNIKYVQRTGIQENKSNFGICSKGII